MCYDRKHNYGDIRNSEMPKIAMLTFVELAVALTLLALLGLALAQLSDRIKGALTPKGLPKAGLGTKAPAPKPTPLDDLTAAQAITLEALAQDRFDVEKCDDMRALRARLAADGRFPDIVEKLDSVLESHCSG